MTSSAVKTRIAAVLIEEGSQWSIHSDLVKRHPELPVAFRPHPVRVNVVQRDGGVS